MLTEGIGEVGEDKACIESDLEMFDIDMSAAKKKNREQEERREDERGR